MVKRPHTDISYSCDRCSKSIAEQTVCHCTCCYHYYCEDCFALNGSFPEDILKNSNIRRLVKSEKLETEEQVCGYCLYGVDWKGDDGDVPETNNTDYMTKLFKQAPTKNNRHNCGFCGMEMELIEDNDNTVYMKCYNCSASGVFRKEDKDDEEMPDIFSESESEEEDSDF